MLDRSLFMDPTKFNLPAYRNGELFLRLASRFAEVSLLTWLNLSKASLLRLPLEEAWKSNFGTLLLAGSGTADLLLDSIYRLL